MLVGVKTEMNSRDCSHQYPAYHVFMLPSQWVILPLAAEDYKLLLKLSQQCAPAAQKTNLVLGFIRSVANKTREVTLPLYSTTLLNHLKRKVFISLEFTLCSCKSPELPKNFAKELRAISAWFQSLVLSSYTLAIYVLRKRLYSSSCYTWFAFILNAGISKVCLVQSIKQKKWILPWSHSLVHFSHWSLTTDVRKDWR